MSHATGRAPGDMPSPEALTIAELDAQPEKSYRLPEGFYAPYWNNAQGQLLRTVEAGRALEGSLAGTRLDRSIGFAVLAAQLDPTPDLTMAVKRLTAAAEQNPGVVNLLACFDWLALGHDDRATVDVPDFRTTDGIVTGLRMANYVVHWRSRVEEADTLLDRMEVDGEVGDVEARRATRAQLLELLYGQEYTDFVAAREAQPWRYQPVAASPIEPGQRRYHFTVRNT